MTGMIVHAGESLDHARDPRQGPQLGREPVRAGALAQRPVQALQVGGHQFRLTARTPGAAQRSVPAAAPRLVPSTDALAAHPQRASHRCHDLAGRQQARRPTAAQFQGVKVSAWHHMWMHAPSIHWAPGFVTLFCEIH